MFEETQITIDAPTRRGLGNLYIENAWFFGKPNFSGIVDNFGDSSRKFTVRIPNEVADDLRDMGWNVKTTIPRTEEEEPISHLKVKTSFSFDDNHPQDVDYERGPNVHIIMGESIEKLNSRTIGTLDRSRIVKMDMEIRAWHYNQDDIGAKPLYSARLVELVATVQQSRISEKYGLSF